MRPMKERIDDLICQRNEMDRKIAELDLKRADANRTAQDIEHKIANLNLRREGLDRQMELVDQRLSALDNKEKRYTEQRDQLETKIESLSASYAEMMKYGPSDEFRAQHPELFE